METIQNKNITYFTMIKVIFRLYGCYLAIYGMMYLGYFISTVMKILSSENLSTIDYYLKISPNSDSLEGSIEFVIGISLFFLSKWISNKIVEDKNKEITIREGELSCSA